MKKNHMKKRESITKKSTMKKYHTNKGIMLMKDQLKKHQKKYQWIMKKLFPREKKNKKQKNQWKKCLKKKEVVWME